MDPEAVRRRRFLLARHGYDPEEVAAFLVQVADHLEAQEATAASPGPGGSVAEVDDANPVDARRVDPGPVDAPAARRLLEEARASAATERLRAQRDIAALERAWQQRRDDLAAQVVELAAERDRLVSDLERALEHVGRLQDWLQRRDGSDRPAPEPTADAASGSAPDDHGEAVPDEAAPHEAATDHAGGPADGHESSAPAAEGAPGPAASGDPGRGVAPSREPVPAESPDGLGDQPAAVPPDEAVSPDEAAQRGEGTLAIVVTAAREDRPHEADDPDDAGASLRRRRDDALQSVADELAATLAPALRRLSARVLEQVDEPTAAVVDLLPAPGRFEELDRAGDDAIVAAFRRGWEQASTTTVDEDARERALGGVGLPRLGVGDDLVTVLLATLEAGREAGEAGPALAERVREVDRDLRRTRLPTEVPDVLREAFHLGLVARHRHDRVPGIAWVVGPERRCPGNRCRANARDGPVVPGRPFAFGEVVPPAHPGCSCVVAPAPAGTGPGATGT